MAWANIQEVGRDVEGFRKIFSPQACSLRSRVILVTPFSPSFFFSVALACTHRMAMAIGHQPSRCTLRKHTRQGGDKSKREKEMDLKNAIEAVLLHIDRVPFFRWVARHHERHPV